jgi:hypothetical protein
MYTHASTRLPDDGCLLAILRYSFSYQSWSYICKNDDGIPQTA